MFSKKHILIKSFRTGLTNFNFQSSNRVRSNLTFHKWTLNYFKNQPPYNKFVLERFVVGANESANDFVRLKTVNTDKLLVKLLSNNTKLSFRDIDNELKNQIDSMSIDQMLMFMDACLSDKHQLYKNSISFKKCVEVMDESWFRRPGLSASQTLQLIYYVSVFKNKSKLIAEYGLQKLINEINYLKQLTDEELSILAVATYKCGAKVNDKILKIFAYRLEKNLEKLIQNPLQFVSLIKPLKKAKYHDPILITKLILVLNKNKNSKVMKDTISSIHLLSFLADANCGNVEFLQTVIDSVGSTMLNHKLENYRIKDVSNYVFSVSYLGLLPRDCNVCEIIIDFLDKIFDTKEKCKKRSKLLIGICLSMWMLNYIPIKLLKFIFSEVSIGALRMPNAHKQDNRLNLLLTCAFIEQPDLIMRCQLVENMSNTMPDVNTHLGERPFLVKVFQALQGLSNKLDISNVEYYFSIPHLKILGIKVLKNNSKVIFIEVLDSSTCLYDTQFPNGMMKLKFRLESKLNYTVISVNYKDNALHNSLLLKSHLESMLSQI